MRPTKLIPFLLDCFKHQRLALIEGAPGVGKSDCVDQAVAKLRSSGPSVEYIVSFPYLEDPTVTTGFPFPAEDKEHATFLPFGAMHKALNSKADYIVWNLEDFGWADFSMQKAYANLVTRRQVNGHRLPDRLVFVSTTNRATDSTGVTGFMEAWKSRCDTIVPFDVSQEDWITWALEHNMPVELIVHIRNHPDRLHKFVPTKELKQSPCPRNWAHAGGWINQGYKPNLAPQANLSERDKAAMDEDNMGVKEIWTGSVGEADAVELYATFELMAKAPDIDAIQLDPDGTPVPEMKDASILYAVTTAMAHRADKQTFDTLLRYAVRMPKSFETLFVKDAHRRKGKEIVNTKGFNKWANLKENREIVCGL